MKEITVLILSLLSLSSCGKGSGKIEGTLTYETSDGVKKMPDSGAAISLFSLNPNIGRKKNAGAATAGSDGKFVLEDIEPGIYFYIIQSKSAPPCPAHVAYSLKLYRQEVKHLFGLDVSQYDSKLLELDELREKYDAILQSDASEYASVSEKISAYESAQAESSKKGLEFLQDLPADFRRAIGYGSNPVREVTMGVVEVMEMKASDLDFHFQAGCR